MDIVDVLTHIEYGVDVTKDMLGELVSIPSIAITHENIEKTVGIVQRMMESVGLSTEIVEIKDACPVICGTGNSSRSDKTLLFYDHYDVQPADPIEEWVSPPFTLSTRIEEGVGRLYGRGVSDNKGDLISRFAVVKAYLDATGDLPVNIKFFIEGEEEAGSPNLEKYVEKCKGFLQADAGIWEFGEQTPDGRPVIFCGLKGNQYAELRIKGSSVDLHSSLAPIVENPAWRLNHALSTLVSAEGKITLDDFYEHVVPITSTDRQQIQNIPFDAKLAKQKWGLSKFKDTEKKSLVETLRFEPSLTICGLISGYLGQGSKTIVPSSATAKIDFRLVPAQSPQEIMQKLRKHLNKRGYTDIEIIDLQGLEPAKTPVTHPFVKLVAEAAQQVYQQPPVIDPLSPASGPLYLFQKVMKCPFVSVGVGHTFSNKHAPNENITVNGFVDGMKFIAHILYAFRESNFL
ncbi:MAG: M20/M25/M40 family metallo-hydrolase [Candidatus Ranarchaeia archaeon]|jgi:acetylornithine deacetylase/succinyl-diaminopimelate desuccinylase-like protein